jgi:hypothetical protein
MLFRHTNTTCYCKFVYLIVASLEGVRVSYLSAQEGLLLDGN